MSIIALARFVGVKVRAVKTHSFDNIGHRLVNYCFTAHEIGVVLSPVRFAMAISRTRRSGSNAY